MSAYIDPKGSKYIDDHGTPSFAPYVLPFVCTDRIDIRGATVAGDLDFQGAHLKGVLDATSSGIGGHALFGPQDYYKNRPQDNSHPLLIKDFIADSELRLDGITVKGNLVFAGSRLNGALKARGMDVTGRADFAPYRAGFPRDGEEEEIWCFECGGDIHLDNSRIGMMLDMRGAQLQGEIIAPSLQVGGRVLMCAYIPPTTEKVPRNLIWFNAAKRVSLSGSVINSDFDLTGARLAEGLRFRGGRVESAMIIDVFRSPDFDGDPHNKKSIDLYNAHVSILSDTGNRKNKKLGYDKSYYLRLEGFAYGRFPHYADIDSLGREEGARRQLLRNAIYVHFRERGRLSRRVTEEELKEKNRKERQRRKQNGWVKTRLKWIKKQYRGSEPNLWTKGPDWIMGLIFPGRKPEVWWKIRSWLNPRRINRHNYNPDPYNTLYRYYKRMGAQSQADVVLRDKLSIERRTSDLLPRLIFSPFDVFFGFGLRPILATAFCITCIYSMASVLSGWEYRQAINVPAPLPAARNLVSHPVQTIRRVGDAALNFAVNGVAAAVSGMKNYSIHGVSLVPSATPDCKQHPLLNALEILRPPPEDDGDNSCDSSIKHTVGWRISRSLATLLSWILSSLTVLTWTGLFRRNVEP